MNVIHDISKFIFKEYDDSMQKEYDDSKDMDEIDF